MVLLGEPLELGEPRHLRLVLGHDLAEHPGRGEAGGPGQVDGRLGVPGPLEHATHPVAQGEDVSRPVQVGGLGGGVDEGADGGGAVGGRDTRGGAVPEVDAHREGGALGLGVGRDHERQLELVGPLGQQRHADHARGVRQEEGDVLGGGRLGGHDEVTLVLPVLVVHDDGHAEAPDGVDGLLDL